MQKDDTLWKGILENVWDDFLRFYFPDADHLFDMERGFTFLDKELEQLFPTDDSKAPKYVDKLVKQFTKNGKENWFLVHIEVQGYTDKDFARRMYTYFYRILDRYDKPVTAIALFTDNNKNFKPDTFSYEYLGTKNIYQFNTYKILEQDERLLEQNPNPFAIVILTVLLALKKKHIDDESLLELKLQIFRNLYRRDITPEKMRGLHTFLKLYVHFAKPETKAKFETEIDIITQNNTTMGIEEMVIERAKKQGWELGIEEGIEKRNIELVQSLIKKTDFSDEQIADISGVKVTFVKKIRQAM